MDPPEARGQGGHRGILDPSPGRIAGVRLVLAPAQAMYPSRVGASLRAGFFFMALATRYLALAASACVLAACSTPVPQVLKPQDLPPTFTGPVAPGSSLWP